MIIEIKDLPQNRNIKKVTFDIEFEDGEPISSSGFNSGVSTSVGSRESVASPERSEVELKRPEIDTEDREKKEIPSEMNDLEF